MVYMTKRNIKQSKNKTRKKLALLRVRAALIPHAGEKYAGDAREAAFKKMAKRPKYIIYLATVHRPASSDVVYLLRKDKGFHLPKTVTFEHIPYDEHSFKWVEPELMRRFPSTKIIAFGPNKYSPTLKNWIVGFMRQHKNCVLLATTDLIHYGERFGNSSYLTYPQQLSKERKERKLIEALTFSPISPDRIAKIANEDKHLMCGPLTVVLFARIIRSLQYTGKVVDYYDSHGVSFDNKLNRYVIDMDGVDSFVSYVSIVYGKGIRQTTVSPFDIVQAIGAVKSAITGRLKGKANVVELPSWSPFNKTGQGVFVGTSINGKTNCSYGRYEDGEKTTAKKIVEAALDCPRDAAQRWRKPYDVDNLDKYDYKVELLDPKSEWKRYPGREAISKFKMDGHHGMFLRLRNGGGATYLPVVARENQDWTKEEYMRHLTQKAGGRGDEWKNGTVEIYRTRSYTWEPHSQRLVSS